jgi:hypothetical protein
LFLLWVYNIDGSSVQESFDIVNRDIHNALAAFFWSPGNVGSNDAVFGVQQRVIGLDWLSGYHIHGGRSQFAGVECVGQILFYN